MAPRPDQLHNANHEMSCREQQQERGADEDERKTDGIPPGD